MHTPPPPPPHTIARGTDPATSKLAAGESAGLVGDHYERILRAMRVVSPGGAEQVADEARLAAYQVRKRLPELARAGRVRVLDGELRRTREGRRERMWALVSPDRWA